MTYRGRVLHILVLPSNGYFTELFVDSLLHNSGVNAEALYIIVYGEKYNGNLPVMNVVNWPEIDNNVVKNAKSLTAMSLTSKNAVIIEKILQENQRLIDDASILMMDDELYRWQRCKDEYGKLIPVKKYLIDDDVIRLLLKIKNFIIPYSPGREILEYITGRDDFVIVDCGVNFRITKNSMYDVFEKQYHQVHGEHDRFKILVSTKPKSAKLSAMFFLCLLVYVIKLPKDKVKNKITVTFWQDKGSILIVKFRDAVVSIIDRIASIKSLDWKFIKIKNKKYPIEEYSELLLRNNALIMQDRGGVTSALEFHYFGGSIYTKFLTFNSRLFSHVLSKRKFCYRTRVQLFDMLLSDDSSYCAKADINAVDAEYLKRRSNDYKYWETRFK